MEVSSSMKDPIYGTLKIQSGGKSVSVAGTNGTALTFKIVWKKDSDGTTCTYFGSQKFNQYTNWQVYVTATAGGSNPNSINCTVISPGSYETTGFNMTYGVS